VSDFILHRVALRKIQRRTRHFLLPSKATLSLRARLSVRQKAISDGILAMRHLYRILKMPSAIPISPSPSLKKRLLGMAMAMRQTRRANQTLPTHRRFGRILSPRSCIFQPLVIAVGLETRWHGVSRVAPSTSQRRPQLHPSFHSWSCSLGLSPSPAGTWFLPQPKLNLHLLPFSPIGPLHRSCTPCGREPPSLCIPPTKNETMSPGSTTERVKRGLSFSPGDDLALARSFDSTTLSTTEMPSDLYWEAVADIYKNQAETRIPRTAKSLLNRFTTLQRVVQKYLAASSAYLPRSGQVTSDRLAEVMTLYRNTNKVQNTKGDLGRAPVFKSTDAAMLLSQCPKFLSIIGGLSATSGGTALHRTASATRVALLLMLVAWSPARQVQQQLMRCPPRLQSPSPMPGGRPPASCAQRLGPWAAGGRWLGLPRLMGQEQLNAYWMRMKAPVETVDANWITRTQRVLLLPRRFPPSNQAVVVREGSSARRRQFSWKTSLFEPSGP